MSTDSANTKPTASASSTVSSLSTVARPSLLIPAIIAVVVVIALAAFLLLGHPGDLFAKPAHEFATRDAEVRSSADPATSTVLNHLQRGQAVDGHWVGKPGPQGWLKIKVAGHDDGFVSGRNLSDHARPTLTATSTGDQVAGTASVVYAEPDQKSAVVDAVSEGETAPTIGGTADGWTEISLNAGGVGYVQSAVFQTQTAPAPAAAPGGEAQSAPPGGTQTTVLGSVTHYVCAFAPGQSVNPPANTGNLSFYLDEGRACINHRYAYFADDTGGLKRVMLNDKARRASVLYFLPGRKAFSRTDFTLSADDYANLQRTSAALETIACPPPGDAAAVAAIKADLVRATPDLDSNSTTGRWNRRVWNCSAR
jgi:hypothetical protein